MNEEIITPEQQEPRRRKLPRLGRRGRILAGALAAIVLAAAVLPRLGRGTAAAGPAYQVARAERRDLTVTVSGTATLEPADAYRVTTLLSGTILDAPFEEDTLVEAGALLYTLDASAARESAERAGLSLQQAQLSYRQAREALYPTAPISGVIDNVYVREGESVTVEAPSGPIAYRLMKIEQIER